MTAIKIRKKLIEVALPLEAINEASALEKDVKVGKPNNMHLWWAPRPHAAARAIIFSQMVDDPSANPDLFPNEKSQDKERKRLFKIIEDLVKWENTTSEEVLDAARQEIWASWRRACADNADHPRAKELFDRNNLPAFHDPFAGGGALPLEAQRLGLDSYASDLNPVAVLVNKAKVEIPSVFHSRAPVNPLVSAEQHLLSKQWPGLSGIASDIQYYGQWIRDRALDRCGNIYPKIRVTHEMVELRPDLRPYLERELNVVSWIWARTVESPNPAFSGVHVPLVSTFYLSVKSGKEAYVFPLKSPEGYSFTVRTGTPENEQVTKAGTSAGKRAGFLCLLSGAPIPYTYIREQGLAGKIGSRLMTIVAEGDRGRLYLSPTNEHEKHAKDVQAAWRPEVPLHGKCRVNVSNYGFNSYGDLFTARQLVALSSLADLVEECAKQIRDDAIKSWGPDDGVPLSMGGSGVTAYSDALSIYLSFAVSRTADWSNSLTRWLPHLDKPQQMFSRHAIAMGWDYVEINALSTVGGSYLAGIKNITNSLERLPGNMKSVTRGKAVQSDASTQTLSERKVISTDPPYYDNIGYADLSDFFYVWLRKTLLKTNPDLFATLAAPKAEELIATPYRHGGKEAAEMFFLDGMTKAMARLSLQAHPFCPVTIYYAFKQSESDAEKGAVNTGWDTFLEAVISSGFGITGTWPIRTEKSSRTIGAGANALASSIVLVCSSSGAGSGVATLKEFVEQLKDELPLALRRLQAGNIAPVDLAQAAIGPGMAIYTRYSKVVTSEGKMLSVRNALMLVNQVLDEQLAEQESNWDADSRWAVVWFEQFSFQSADFGQADQLARAKNTAVSGVVEAGVALSSGGKVRLLKPDELPEDWAPETDKRLTVWEMLHHLIRLQKRGEAQAAAMLARLGDKADAAKELAYRLYGICERKKRSAEGQLYNDLIMVWPDLVARSKEAPPPVQRPGELNLDN